MPERRKKKNLKSSRHAARAPKKKPALPKKKTKVSAKKPAAAKKDRALPVYDLKGKSVGTLTLDPLFQAQKVNAGVVYQSVLMYRAGSRMGTAATKDRGHVRGGGRKPWKQKGTGQARHGSRRSPLWRGGGTTFGPMPRDYSYTIPSQIRRQAVVEVVKDKIQQGQFFLVNRLDVESPKTKHVRGILDALKLQKPIFLVEEKKNNLMLGSRNIPALSVKTAGEVNALDLASHKECVMTQAAYQGLVKRLKS